MIRRNDIIMSPKKKKPSLAVRICGMTVALVVIIIGLWIGFTAQQGGYDLIMFAGYGIATLCFLLCLGIAAGKVTPATYIGTFDM